MLRGVSWVIECCMIPPCESLCHQRGGRKKSKRSISQSPCPPTLSLGMRRSSEPCFRNTFPAKHSTEHVKITACSLDQSIQQYFPKPAYDYIHSFTCSTSKKADYLWDLTLLKGILCKIVFLASYHVIKNTQCLTHLCMFKISLNLLW